MSGVAGMRVPKRDHVAVLHNCGPSTSTVAVTGSVGRVSHCVPSHTITWLLAELGLRVSPAQLIDSRHPRHIATAYVALAVGAALRMATVKGRLTCNPDDAPLLADLRAGGHGAAASDTHHADLALERLASLPAHTQRLLDGTRFFGIVQWIDRAARHDATPATRGATGRVRAANAVLELSAIAFASPPILSMRRAPSLEYFRVEGALVLRQFSSREAV